MSLRWGYLAVRRAVRIAGPSTPVATSLRATPAVAVAYGVLGTAA